MLKLVLVLGSRSWSIGFAAAAFAPAAARGEAYNTAQMEEYQDLAGRQR